MQSKQGKSEDESGRSFRAGNVLIYDARSLMPFSKDLGAAYVWVHGRPKTHSRDTFSSLLIITVPETSRLRIAQLHPIIYKVMIFQGRDWGTDFVKACEGSMIVLWGWRVLLDEADENKLW